MILGFRGEGTRDIYHGTASAAARRTLPQPLWSVARRKLDYLDAAVTLQDLRVPPANRLEALKGDRKGQYSIRINDRFRICFVWTENGSDEVEITDYH